MFCIFNAMPAESSGPANVKPARVLLMLPNLQPSESRVDDPVDCLEPKMLTACTLFLQAFCMKR